MRDQDLSRRQLLWGSSAAVAAALLIPGMRLGTAPRSAPFAAAEGSGGALLTPRGRPGTVSQSAPRIGAAVTGATVAPRAYGIPGGTTAWLQAAKRFDSYVGLRLATRMQKIYLQEGHYYTHPLPPQITTLARAGCQFIVCVYPSRTTDERAKLARFLRLLNSHGIVYQVALTNEWNCGNKFPSAQAYLRYWRHYAPVVKAAGVPLCNLVCASSSATAYNKIQPGFPTSPLPDRYWIDYYATAYKFKVRLDTAGGLLDQAEGYGVPVGIAEFGWAAGGGTLTMAEWDKYCSYLVGLVPRLPLGCLYWGAVHNGLTYDVVTGPDDPKVPGIQQVINGFKAG